MLEEYLNHQKVSNDLYVSQVKGLTAYSFKKQQDSFYCLSPDVHKNSLEIFFCLGGKLKLENQTHDLYSIVSGEIALLSGIEPMLYCQTEGMLEGILICMDVSHILENFDELYGETANIRNICGWLDRATECRQVKILGKNIWTDTVFSVLNTLESSERRRYCILKAIELVYLIQKESYVLQICNGNCENQGYAQQTAEEMRQYLKQHLDQKLTIKQMSQRYCLSHTAFKEYFRRMNGCPFHKWLLQQRMAKAVELLRHSSMSILEVAQSVGYEGVSQFNVVFKRIYGVTPSKYRKMSDTGDF